MIYPPLGAAFYEPGRRFSVEKGNGTVIVRDVQDGDAPAECEWARVNAALVLDKGWWPQSPSRSRA